MPSSAHSPESDPRSDPDPADAGFGSIEDSGSARVLHAVSYAAERFLRAGDWLAAANDVMERLGRASDASRVYLFENRRDAEGTLRACHIAEWVTEGIEPQLGSPDLEDPAYEGGFGRWAERLSRDQPVQGFVADFPDDEQELLRAQGIRSLVVVPVFVHGEWWGFLGFDECFHDRLWSVSEQAALTTAADILGAAVQRERAEQALRERETHYRRLVKMSPYSVFALDMQGRLTEINRAGEELVAQPASVILGRSITDLLPESDHEAMASVFRSLTSGALEKVDFEGRILGPDGSLLLVQVAASPIRDDVQGDGSTLLGVQGIARDVTEERAREEHLRRAERLASLGTLVGGVAHELNNPLTSIRGLAELLLEDTEGEERREVLATVVREADRTAAIVDDLRVLARQTQHTRRRRQPTDVHDIVGHVLKVRGYAIETQSIDVLAELADELPNVSADPSELEQVLLNLVVNAEQALEESDGDRRILVRTRVESDDVVVEVEDTGPGIPEEHLPRLFDPFWTTKNPDVGTGLGLSLVHKIMVEHGGEISVDSTEGVGTVFRLRLPRASESAQADEGAADGELEAPTETPDRSLSILVVDDEESIRQLLEVALSRFGHRVDVVGSAAEALRRLLADEPAAGIGEKYDLVLSDLKMPDLHGSVLLERLEERDPQFCERIIFMTGDIYSQQVDRLTERGIPLLRKPFRLDDVQEVLRQFGAGRP